MPLPRIVYAGTPAFAVPALAALLDAGYPLAAVYTQPDRPAGRGRQPQQSPVKQAAVAAGIEVRQPETLKGEAETLALRALAPDLLIVAAYGLLLPRAILAVPPFGCLNIHASLLPRWRGAAPIQRAIAAGDAETGISLMQMEAGLDTGPVYAMRTLDIAPRETGGSLHDRLAALGAELLIATLPGILAGTLTAVPQDATAATYARKLDKAEARIDWTQSAEAIDRQVRAFDPWPVAETRLDGDTLRVWAAEPLAATSDTSANAAPGQVIATGKAGIDVATGAGTLRITRLQLPGRRAMAAAELRNARHLDGAVLG